MDAAPLPTQIQDKKGGSVQLQPKPPVFSMTHFLQKGERHRLERLTALHDDCELMLVVNPLAPSRFPQLASVIDPELSIGQAVKMVEEYVPSDPSTCRLGEQLSHLLMALGICGVNRECVLSHANERDEDEQHISLLESFARSFHVSQSDLVNRTVRWLTGALTEYAPLKLERGLVSIDSYAIEAYLLFFKYEDLGVKMGCHFPCHVPKKGAVPELALSLRSNGISPWLYYDANIKDRFSSSERLRYQDYSADRYPVQQVITQLTQYGAVHGKWFGIDLSHVAQLRKRFLNLLQSSLNVEARLQGNINEDPETGEPQEGGVR